MVTIVDNIASIQYNEMIFHVYKSESSLPDEKYNKTTLLHFHMAISFPWVSMHHKHDDIYACIRNGIIHIYMFSIEWGKMSENMFAKLLSNEICAVRIVVDGAGCCEYKKV